MQDSTDGQWHSTCVLDAVRADGADVMADRETHAALRTAVADGVGAELVWARRGLLDEPQGLYDEGRLAALDLPGRRARRPRSTRTTTTSSSATVGSPRSPTPSIVSSATDRAARAASADSLE